MQKTNIAAIILSIVMISGLLFTNIGFEKTFAVSDKGLEEGKAMGCENGVAKNNKHCDDIIPPIGEDGDGISDADDLCPLIPQVSSRDHDGDGVADTKDTNPCDPSIQ